jgi:hypothetical protein
MEHGARDCPAVPDVKVLICYDLSRFVKSMEAINIEARKRIRGMVVVAADAVSGKNAVKATFESKHGPRKTTDSR